MADADNVGSHTGVVMLGMTATEMAVRFRTATQSAAQEHLDAGRAIYGSYGSEQVYAVLPRKLDAGNSAAPESRAS